MPAGIRTHAEDARSTDTETTPEVTVCESSPGTAVFLEAGNTDGWIATDSPVEIRQ